MKEIKLQGNRGYIGMVLNTNIDEVLVLNYFVDDLFGTIGG